MITLTQKAHNKLAPNVPQDSFLRFSVRAGGCSGFLYNMQVTKERSPTDLVLEFDSFKMVVDEKSLDYLIGTEVDYVEELFGSSFKYNNPNAERCCGCGESFS